MVDRSPEFPDDRPAGPAERANPSSATTRRLQVSVICPFFNEEAIIRNAVTTMLGSLATMDVDWELIVVNDGSRDGSKQIVEELLPRHPNLRLVSYPVNRGRGHALRAGIGQARGDVVVTTEIDLSWGEDIVPRLYAAMLERPEVDVIVASPNLPGGGYRNVPAKRVWISRFGNRVIRACMSNAMTMNTGMTRAYRREAIQALPLEEDGKEFHLEVILKARALGYRMGEIPCVLAWKQPKLEGAQVQRKSSSKVNKLIVSHSLFSIFANPIRHVWGMALLAFLGSLGFFVAGVIRYMAGLVSVYMLIISLSLALFALVFFSFGVIAYQGNAIQKELWSLKRSALLRSMERDQERRRDEEPG